MEFTSVKKQQWSEIKEIYMEAFPKAERKPYFVLRHSVKKKKAFFYCASQLREKKPCWRWQQREISFWDLQFLLYIKIWL